MAQTGNVQSQSVDTMMFCPMPSLHPYHFHIFLSALALISLTTLLKSRSRQKEWDRTQDLTKVSRSWCNDRQWD